MNKHKKIILFLVIFFQIGCLNYFTKKQPKLPELTANVPDIELYASRLINEMIEKVLPNYSSGQVKTIIFDFKEISRIDGEEFQTTFLSKLVSDYLKERIGERVQFSLRDEWTPEIYKLFYIDSLSTYDSLLLKNVNKFSMAEIVITGTIEEIEDGNKIVIKNNIFDATNGDSVLSFEFTIEKRMLISIVDETNSWDSIITRKREITKGLLRVYFKYNLSIPPPNEPKYTIIKKTPFTDQDLTCDKFLELPSGYRSLFQSITWPEDILITVDNDEFSEINFDIMPEIVFQWSTTIPVVEREYAGENHIISIKFTEIVPNIELTEENTNRIVEKKWSISLIPNITNQVTIEYKITEKGTPELFLSEAWTESELKYFDKKNSVMVIPRTPLAYREVSSEN